MKITNSLVMWIAKNCRPINMVGDDGMREVIRASSGDSSYNPPLRGIIVSRIHTYYKDERARRRNKLEEAADVALTGDQ